MKTTTNYLLAIFLSLFGVIIYAQTYQHGVVVELKGVLVSPTAGPEMTIDEKPHKFFALELKQPISVSCASADQYCEPETNLAFLQWVLRSPYLEKFKAMEGKDVRLVGKLFSASTGHHFTRVLLDVQEINPNMSFNSDVQHRRTPVNSALAGAARRPTSFEPTPRLPPTRNF